MQFLLKRGLGFTLKCSELVKALLPLLHDETAASLFHNSRCTNDDWSLSSLAKPSSVSIHLSIRQSRFRFKLDRAWRPDDICNGDLRYSTFLLLLQNRRCEVKMWIVVITDGIVDSLRDWSLLEWWIVMLLLIVKATWWWKNRESQWMMVIIFNEENKSCYIFW